MTSFLGELKRRNVVRVAVAYAIVALLVIAVGYLFVDNYVLNAPRPPFAGAEVDPESLTAPLDDPPAAGATIAPPPPLADDSAEAP